MTTFVINETRTPLRMVAAIIAISIVASLFLCWLVYYHAPTDVAGTHLLFLPALNALLNALSATALVTGFLFIRSGRVEAHRSAMFTAFIFSSLFLISYITNHDLNGDMRFQGQCPIPSADASPPTSASPVLPFRFGSMSQSPVSSSMPCLRPGAEMQGVIIRLMRCPTGIHPARGPGFNPTGNPPALPEDS